MSRYLVMNIGCIECGVSSDVVGVYDSEDEANRVSQVCSDKLSWREGGQNAFEVFDLQKRQAEEYSEVLAWRP